MKQEIDPALNRCTGSGDRDLRVLRGAKIRDWCDARGSYNKVNGVVALKIPNHPSIVDSGAN